MNRRHTCRAGLTATAFLLALTLSACGNGSGIASDENGTASVRLASSITGSSFLAVTAGIDQGIFDKHHVNLKVVKIKSTAEATAALASGDADIAAALTEGVIAANANGAKLKIVGNLMTQDQHVLYADAGVKSVADLKGKKFGVVGPGSGTEMLAKALAVEEGLKESDITYVPTGAASTQLTSLVSGQIDAAGLVPPYDSTAAERGKVEVLRYRDVFPDITPQVFTTTSSLISAHSPELKRFMAAYTESAAWVKEHPSEAVAILRKDARISAEAAKAAYEFAEPDYSTTGEVSIAGLRRWIEMSKKYGNTDKRLPTVDELYDPSLLPGSP